MLRGSCEAVFSRATWSSSPDGSEYRRFGASEASPGAGRSTSRVGAVRLGVLAPTAASLERHVSVPIPLGLRVAYLGEASLPPRPSTRSSLGNAGFVTERCIGCESKTIVNGVISLLEGERNSNTDVSAMHPNAWGKRLGFGAHGPSPGRGVSAGTPRSIPPPCHGELHRLTHPAGFHASHPSVASHRGVVVVEFAPGGISKKG